MARAARRPPIYGPAPELVARLTPLSDHASVLMPDPFWRIAGGVTWHGSRMENFLDRAADTTCPFRLHFGADDPITPSEAIDEIRTAFAGHPDASIAVHPGAVHGYALGGDAYDSEACQAGLDATKELLESLV